MQVRSDELWRACSRLPDPATYDEGEFFLYAAREHRPPPLNPSFDGVVSATERVQQLVFKRVRFCRGSECWWEWVLEVA